ncbi:YxD-tail cyclophane-containing RiPP peptide [Streptomyces phaeochromogenes]|uniref:YxD-tail cyclophane-containing RiPP peptide n=1 Tax=Streptomyces phaeochromogenes TaxID=1923 RepID=UPI00386F70CB
MQNLPSASPAWAGLPDFSDLDVRILTGSTGHAVLSSVTAALLARSGTDDTAVAFYEDSIL